MRTYSVTIENCKGKAIELGNVNGEADVIVDGPGEPDGEETFFHY